MEAAIVAPRPKTEVGEETRKKKRTTDPVEEILASIKVFDEIKSYTKTVAKSPSSVMLQILKYGKTFKRVIETVYVDHEAFDNKLSDLISSGKLSIVPLYKLSYKRHWTPEDNVNVTKEEINKIMEPLNDLGVGEFKLKMEPKVNKFFSESVKSYVKEEKVTGISFYDEKTNTLTIFSKVYGRSQLGSIYYTMLRMKPVNKDSIEVSFFCTCPWAMGLTLDSRGKRIPATYSSMCKHGIATLFYYFPEVSAYLKMIKSGNISKDAFEKTLSETRKAFEEFQKRLDQYIQKNPAASDIVFSNVAYLMWREFFNEYRKIGTLKKLVPTVRSIPDIAELWRTLRVKREVESVEESTPSATETKTIDVGKALKKLEKTRIFTNIRKIEKLLNGLQGSRTSTLYTKALLAGLLLGSDLESDPVIVSVVGDPGTGKTLTAEGLVRLIGIRTLIVEKEISKDIVKKEVLKQISVNIPRFVEFFKKVIESKIPEDQRSGAEKFLEEFIDKSILLVENSSTRDLVRIAKKFSETFTALYGVKSKKAKVSIARLFYEILKFNKKIYETYTGRKAIERKALEERRSLLKLVADLGLITSPEEKENVNSGAVRWEVIETATGYKVRVKIDLHYLIRRYDGNFNKIRDVLEKLALHGDVYVETETPGLAELKLSEAEYLEKALRVREEDILSPAKRLIWVGGDITKKILILIDESRRAPELLERLLTDLSSAARDTRRTNLIVTTDNAEPLMEAESDPRLDAFHSRVNFEVITPSTTVSYVISQTLEEISRLEREKKTPLITLDEALLLNYLSRSVSMPERYEKILYSIPLLLIYDFKILRPETVMAIYGSQNTENTPPLILLVPKGSVDLGNVKGDYVEVEWGKELPAIRMMPERRFGHHVVRAAKALAIIDGKPSIDKETFLNSLEMVLLARVIPVGEQFPYLYLDAKKRVTDAIIDKVRELIEKKDSPTEKLIEVLGSFGTPTQDLLNEALEEMIQNPVATALFVRFLEQMLVSEHAKEFIELSKKIPGLYRTLSLIARYEKIFMRFH